MTPQSFKTAISGKAETVVNKSRFICYLEHVGSMAEVESKLAEIRKRHADATHVCFAAIADRVGDESRYGDDGEPTGTAGQPMLAVLRGEELKMTLAVTVRYFGGIKLGVGGLARAYGDSVKNAIAAAEIRTYRKYFVYGVSVGYTEYNALAGPLSAAGIETVSQNFGENVMLEIAVLPETDAEKLINGVLRRKCDIKFMGEKFL